ncbi:MAG: sporulation membrane protein YtaF [Oscillospiraceae bacterium]|nr:sporulation membrane protein YtaF [Oscillospiraceae bacterium]
MFFSILQAALLAGAVSIDALAASFAYGSQKIRIPLRSLIIISLICSGVLGVTLLLGAQMGEWIDDSLAAVLSFTILFGLGLLRVCDSGLKNWIRRRGDTGGQIKFSAFNLKFILQIYADPKAADADGSRVLSLGEAAVLALALSLDGIAAGLGAGLSGAGAWLVTGMTFGLTVLAVALGCRLGGRLAERLRVDLSWISGGLLILLAILQL